MKVIVAGSREWSDRAKVFSVLDHLKKTLPVTELVSGTARGVDRMGELWAEQRGVPIKRFPAAWRYPDGLVDRGAGHKRNAVMAAYGDALVAFWDGESPGTKSMIRMASDRGLVTFIYTKNGTRTQYN
jgi:hypothetical protein